MADNCGVRMPLGERSPNVMHLLTSPKKSTGIVKKKKIDLKKKIDWNHEDVTKPKKPATKIQKALELDQGCGDVLVDKNLLLPSDKGKVADNLAAFIIFNHLRFKMFEERQQDGKSTASNEIFEHLHFTNIHREVDTGTRFLRKNLLTRTRTDMETVFMVIVYRTINRIETFEEFGEEKKDSSSCLPGPEDVKLFLKFLKRKKEAGETLFTAAHQALSFDKIVLLYNSVLKDLEIITNNLINSETLEDAFNVILALNNLGPFYSYQILVDLVEIDLLKFTDNSWTCLGPGARNGLCEIFGDVAKAEEMVMVVKLKTMMDHGFSALGMRPIRFLNRKMSLKSVEHSLCEFSNFCRAAKMGVVRGRKYSPRYRREEGCEVCQQTDECQLSCVLCSRTFHMACLSYPWVNTMIDFWLCAECHAIETGKGSNEDTVVYVEGEVKLMGEGELKKRLKLRKVM